MEPFLKAVGGKRWLATSLAREIISAKPEFYVEPFAGGGAVGLVLPPSLPKLVSDTNPAVAAIWWAFRYKAPEEVLAAIQKVERAYPDTGFGYAQARIALNGYLLGYQMESEAHKPTWYKSVGLEFVALARYINFRCFNGLWRVNQSGEFNVPWARYKNPTKITLAELNQYKHVLASFDPRCVDFRILLNELVVPAKKARGARIAVYADPPYDGMFDDYTSNSFDETDQRDLARWLKYLASLGVRIWTTNADTALIRELYSWAQFEPLTEQHLIAAKATRRGQKPCLMIRSPG